MFPDDMKKSSSNNYESIIRTSFTPTRTAKVLLQQKNQFTAFINSGTLNKELLAQQIPVCLISRVSEKENYQKIRFFTFKKIQN